MYLTIYKKQIQHKQLTFADLFADPTALQYCNSTQKQITIETEMPKKIPDNIAYYSTQLKHFGQQFYKELNYSKEEIAEKYKTHRIPKKTGGYRTINAPDEDLKFVQRYAVNVLQNFNTLMHDAAHAYVKGRSPKTANEVHQANNSNWFLHIDLKDFFGSCKQSFVYQQISKIYPFCLLQLDAECDTIIKQIINLACLNGALPQGNPLAPYLTNLLMVPLDYRLNKLAPVYTRYSDDMLFSSRKKLNTEHVVAQIQQIFKKTPLKINEDKTRLGSKNGNNWNLGLMLNKDNNITVGHETKRQYKAAIDQFLYNPEQYDATAIQKLAGITAYYTHIEPEYFNHIIGRYSAKHQKDLLKLLKGV